MGLEKVALNFMVERGGKLTRSLLCTKPPKMPINIKGLSYAPLNNDVVQFSRKVKPAETYISMIEHFMTKHPQNKKLVQNLAIKGVEAHPSNLGLIGIKNFLSNDSNAYLSDLSRSISLKPNSQSYLMRYQEFMEQGKSKEAFEDLKKALEYAKKEKCNPEIISEIENMLCSNVSDVARKLKPLPLTNEQKAFNTTVDNYWNKYQKEINEAFDEKGFFQLSNANCTMVETTAKNHLLNSIKQVGKAEDFGLTRNQQLYHGTDSHAYNSIKTYGFDLSKCGRTETGKGAYFGFDEQAVRKAYGSNVIVTRFTGKNVAKMQPGVYDVVCGSGAITPFKFTLADKLGLDISKDNEILEEIISKYYNKLLESKGIEGIITDTSFNAGMPYFMVPNPSKYIEIL